MAINANELSGALAINSSGDVAGFTLTPASTEFPRPFIYSGGTMTLICDFYGYATGVNDSGQVTGLIQLPGRPSVDAFLYQDGTLTDLGGLPGFSNMPYSIGWAINNSGTIVGESKAEAMLYQDGRMIGFSRRAAQT